MPTLDTICGPAQPGRLVNRRVRQDITCSTGSGGIDAHLVVRHVDFFNHVGGDDEDLRDSTYGVEWEEKSGDPFATF